MASTLYWATLPPDELAGAIMSHIRDWRRYFFATGLAEKAAKGHRYYYGRSDSGDSSSYLAASGERQDLVRHVVNGIRPLVQRASGMLLANAPDMSPVAANSDAEAREQAIVSKGILEHIHREHDVDTLRRESLLAAMVMGEAARAILWDANKGEPTIMGPDGQPAEYAGDFRNLVLTPFDLYRDPGYRAFRDAPWVAFREWVNKYELAALHPEKASEILAMSENEGIEDGDALIDIRWRLNERTIDSDTVCLYHFYHKDTRAVPGGRHMTLLSAGLWLTEGPNPYDGLPVHPLAPDRVLGTSLGYTNVYDALGVEDMLHALHSAMATNANRFALGTIVRYKGDGIEESRLANGALAISVNSPDKKPEPLEYPPTPPDVYAYADRLSKLEMQSLGLNETSMGTPPFSGMAAQAMALLDSKAQEYQDSLAKGLTAFDAACATAEIRILKVFAKDPRNAVIAGKAKSWMLKSFTGEDLRSVDRITVEPTRAGSASLAFKFGLLEMLAQFGVQLKPEQIIDLANTGQLESQFEHEETNLLRIKRENELLSEGQMPAVLIARTHWLDIKEHMSLLNSPEMEEKPEVVKAVLDTVQAKLDAWRSMPPDLLMLLGGPTPPPLVPPGMPVGPDGMPLPPEGGLSPAPPPSEEGFPAGPPPPQGPQPGTAEGLLSPAQEAA